MAGPYSVDWFGLWLAPVSDLSDQVHVVDMGVQVTPFRSKAGTHVRYMNGRIRMVTVPGTAEGVSVFIAQADQTTAAFIDLHAGDLMQYRDSRGRLLYGGYLEPSGAELPGDYRELAFDFTAVTHSIEV